METKNEKQYYLIWLYISLLLHLIVIIIMLTLPQKPTEPDPANNNKSVADVIFYTPEPEPQNIAAFSPYIMQKRVQGSTTQEKTQFDPLEQAVTKDFATGLKDETTLEHQPLADASITDQAEPTTALQESSAIDSELDNDKQAHYDPTPEEIVQEKTDTVEQAQEQTNTHHKIDPVKIAEIVASNKFSSVKDFTTASKKIESKKHRPIDVGDENRSKLQLTKPPVEKSTIPKKKISLNYLQDGFTNFMNEGNANFSSNGNAEKDSAMGFMLANYQNQVGRMHENAFRAFPYKLTLTPDEYPTSDSVITIEVDRSGKTTLKLVESSGIEKFDNYHMKVMEFMGHLPPVPKSLPVPLVMSSRHTCPGRTSGFVGMQPGKLFLK